jgi:hypothetical protein
MSNTVTQRNVTRNQSTADYEFKRIFVFDNRFEKGSFRNTTAAAITLLPASLVARDTAVVNGFRPVTAGNLADVIGISANEESIGLVVNGTTNINICTKGTIDAIYLALPATVTLNTVVGNKTLKDVLEAIGFHIDTSSVEHTKFDN